MGVDSLFRSLELLLQLDTAQSAKQQRRAEHIEHVKAFELVSECIALSKTLRGTCGAAKPYQTPG